MDRKGRCCGTVTPCGIDGYLHEARGIVGDRVVARCMGDHSLGSEEGVVEDDTLMTLRWTDGIGWDFAQWLCTRSTKFETN